MSLPGGIILVSKVQIRPMKNLFLPTYTVIAIGLVVASFMFSACTKKGSSNSLQPSNTCSASKAGAENIGIFPADNPWNKDISGDPVEPYSNQIIANFSSSAVKADFGSGVWNGAPIGIPYVVVCGNQQKVAVNFTDYGDESDAGPYAIPLNAPIEGNGNGDSHVISVDIENGTLYELFNAHVNGNYWMLRQVRFLILIQTNCDLKHGLRQMPPAFRSLQD
jgi:hypothetical protein